MTALTLGLHSRFSRRWSVLTACILTHTGSSIYPGTCTTPLHIEAAFSEIQTSFFLKLLDGFQLSSQPTPQEHPTPPSCLNFIQLLEITTNPHVKTPTYKKVHRKVSFLPLSTCLVSITHTQHVHIHQHKHTYACTHTYT